MELTTLKNLKEYLGITSNDEDGLLTHLIQYVSGLMRVYVGWDITKAVIENDVRDSYSSITRLQGFPILTGDELDVDDEEFLYEYNAGTLATPNWQTMLASNYFLNKEEGVVETLTKLDGFKDIRFTYTCGYDEVPKEVEAAALKAAARMYNHRKSEGIATEGIENANVQWSDELSKDEIMVLGAYCLGGKYLTA